MIFYCLMFELLEMIFFVFKTGKKQKQTDKIVLLAEMCGKKEKNIRKTRLLILVGNTEISMVYSGIEFSF